MSVQRIVRIVRASGILRRICTQQLLTAVRRVNYLPSKLVLGAPFAARLVKADSATPAEADVLLEADALFEQGLYQKLYDKFKDYSDGQSAEMLWRLGRALYHTSKDASEEEAKAMIREAYDLVSKALALGDDNYAVHKWYAVLLDAKSKHEGKKAQIQQLRTVKDHLLRSSELNPGDATILHMLGNWCYHVSDLAWYQRKIAAAIFAVPPESSFEEALEFLLKAEQIDPHFYSQNLLLLGKTYLKMSRREEALRYLKLASEYPARNNDDRDAKQEATKLLNSL